MYVAEELEALTKKELTQIARDLDCAFSGKDSKATLVEKILESQPEEDSTPTKGAESPSSLSDGPGMPLGPKLSAIRVSLIAVVWLPDRKAPT